VNNSYIRRAVQGANHGGAPEETVAAAAGYKAKKHQRNNATTQAGEPQESA